MSTFGVIFDMDGVLVDSYQAHFQSWRETALLRGLDMTEPDFKRTFGRTSREIIAQLWPGRVDLADVPAFDAAKEQAYRRILQQHLPAMPGAGDLLASLHHAGFRLAIGSSGPPENVALVHRYLPNSQLFTATVDGSEVRHGKPDPEVFLVAARKLGLAPSRCAVVEDALVGIEAARRAAMTTIALTGTTIRESLAPRAHAVIDSLADLTPDRIADLIHQHQSHAPA